MMTTLEMNIIKSIKKQEWLILTHKRKNLLRKKLENFP